MRKQIVNILFLCLSIGLAGCSGDEPIEDIDPDIPQVEITDEEMEAAVENLQKVETAMSPLFLACEDAAELGAHLEEIKAMEGVEDAYVCDETTFAIKIEKGGMTYYYYPPEPVLTELPELTNEGVLRAAMTKADVCEDKNVLIINQLSNDERFEHSHKATQIVKRVFTEHNFNVEVVNSEDFTAETLFEEMPKYGVTFLMTHGTYDDVFDGEKKTHWLVTGEKCKDLKGERLKKWEEAWVNKKACAMEVKNETSDGSEVEVKYVAINELYLKDNLKFT